MMSKDKLTEYDATASNNTDVGGISVAEGMLPSAVNNCLLYTSDAADEP